MSDENRKDVKKGQLPLIDEQITPGPGCRSKTEPPPNNKTKNGGAGPAPKKG